MTDEQDEVIDVPLIIPKRKKESDIPLLLPKKKVEAEQVSTQDSKTTVSQSKNGGQLDPAFSPSTALLGRGTQESSLQGLGLPVMNEDVPKTGATPEKTVTVNTPFGQSSISADAPINELTPAIFSSAIQRGLNQGELADMLAVGRTPTSDDIKRIAELQRSNRQLETQKSDAYKKFNESKGFGEAMSAFVSTPTAPLEIITELSLESLSALAKHGATRMALGAAEGAAVGSVIPGLGTATGAGYGMLSGMGMSSLNLEYSGKILETLAESGINLEDEQSLKDGFANEKLMSEARTLALKKGVPVALFDMVSGKIGGKFLPKGSSTVSKKIVAGAKEVGAQSALGGGGEIAGELTAGEELNAPAILGEVFGEVGGGLPDIATGAFIRKAEAGENITGDLLKISKELPKAQRQEVFNETIDISEGIGEVTPEQAVNLKEQFAQTIAADEKIPENVPVEKREVIIPLISEKSKLEGQVSQLETSKATVDDSFHPEIDNEITASEKRIEEIRNDIAKTIKAEGTKLRDEVGLPLGEPAKQKEESSIFTDIPKELSRAEKLKAEAMSGGVVSDAPYVPQVESQVVPESKVESQTLPMEVTDTGSGVVEPASQPLETASEEVGGDVAESELPSKLEIDKIIPKDYSEKLSSDDRSDRDFVINSEAKAASKRILKVEEDKSRSGFNAELYNALKDEVDNWISIKKKYENVDFNGMQGIPPRRENGEYIKNGKEYSEYIDNEIIPTLNKNISNLEKQLLKNIPSDIAKNKTEELASEVKLRNPIVQGNEVSKTKEQPKTATPKEEVVTPLKDVVSTAKALDKLEESGSDSYKNLDDSDVIQNAGFGEYDNTTISEAYHKAKADGSNPELVKAVESALKDQPNQPTNEKEKRKEEGLLSPKEKKEEVKPIGGNIELSKEEKSAGFIKLPIAKVKKALKDFQGRIADYSKTTYDSIVNEAKDGTLNISSIPAIQVWGQTGELLAGHSRVKAFEDLASGKLPLNEKFKTSDFENINTQIVDAETRDEAKKIAERSNSGAQQTPFENSKILARMRKDGANKTAIDKEAQRLAQFGDKKHTINLSNLDPNGKAATTLEAAEKSPEKLGKEKVESIRLAADKAGEMRGEFSELTKLHEDEIFDALVNGKIKASEVEARINRVVNSAAEQFDPNNKLNIESIANISPQEMVFQQKTADLRKEIKDLQRSIKKDAETKLTPIEQDYLERAIVLNNGDTKKGRSEFESEATKKLITKKTEDAKALIKRRQEDLQTHLLSKKNLSGAPSLFDVVNQEIKNKTITNEQANKFIEATEDVTKDESAIKNLESKAESTDEVTLKEVIKEADALIENATKEEVISSQSKTTTDGKEKSTDSTSEKAEKVDKGGDTKAPTTEKKFTEKSKKIAEKIRSFKSKPLELKDEKGNPIIIAKKGIDQNDIIEGIAKLVEAGGQLADAIATELSKHKWYNDLTDKGKEGVRKQFEDHLSKDVTGITHEKTEETRTEFGLGDFYEKTTKEDEALFAEADKQIKEGYNIESLISKLEQGHIPSDLETTILKKYKATVEAKIAKDPSDENLADLRRLVKATDVAGTLAGRGLRSRQGLEIRDDSLAGYFTRETDVNQDAPLTETQKERVIKEHTEITEAQKAFNEKIAELEAENAKLKADAELKKLKANTKKTKKTHDDFVAERKSLIDQFKEEGKFDKNKPQAQGISLTNKQVVIIGKLAKSYVDEGISKLGDVVTKIASELGLSERDVQDVLAGEYNEKKKTKTELAQTLLDIKEQAKLINKLDALLRGETPKVEKAKIQRNQEIEGLRKRIKDLQKERADAERKIKNDESKTQREANKKTPEQQALDNLKKRYEREINTITEDLRTGNFDKSLPKPPLKLDKEAIDLKDRLIKLKREREIRLIKQEYANRTAQQRAVDKVVEVLNVPRTLMSSMDFSAPLRQAVVVTVSHPQIAAGAGLEMFKQSVSQKRFDRWFSDVRQMPRWKLMEDSGLYVADPHDPRLTAKEEAFMNNLVEKIPFIGGAVKIPNSVPVIGGKKIGGLVKGTERAYVGYLNKMRVDLFNRFADAFEAKGHTFENSPELFKGLASYVNNSTGRGKLGVLESSAPMLNTAFFAPRLIASRINMLNPLYYKQLPKPVRVQALKDMAVFIGVGITVLTIAKLLGADVEDDPRSSDFGKIKDGNTRWDIWGGFQAYVRIIAQVLTGQSKSARTGSIQELSGEGAFGRDRGDVVGSFLRGKLAPIPAMTWNLIKGETMTGEKATPFSELREHMMPMIAGDLKDAMKDRGVRSLYEVGLPSMFGIGASTYLPRGYDKVNKKDPVYEFLYKKNMNLSEPQQGELTDDEYKKMMELREPIFRDKWEVIIENGALIDKEGKVTIDKDEDVSKKKVDELNMEELSSLMKSVGNSATREAKKKVILKEDEQKKSRRIKL